MNLRQMEVFRAIMLTGSVSSAARLLSVSQPAVSRVLRQTEDRLKMPLFIRRANGLQATAEAYKLYAEVEKVFAGVLKIEALAKDLTSGKTGSLSILSNPSMGHSLVPQVIGAFNKSHPDVQVSFDVLLHEAVVDAVAHNKCDLAVSLMLVNHPNLECTPLTESRLLCLCRKDHELADRREIGISDLVSYRMVLQAAETPIGAVIRQYFSTSDVHPDVICEVRLNWLAATLAQEGVGIAIADEHSVDLTMWPDLVALSLKDAPSLHYHLLTSINQPPSMVAKSFIAELHKMVARRAPDHKRSA